MVGRLSLASLRARADEPIDAASLAAFRIGFGALMVVASLRFFSHGWIEADYTQAKVFFPYWGLSFIRPWPGHGMYVHYAAMALFAALVCVGLFYRVAIVAFTLAFTWAHLSDKTNYLNHYYLVSLVATLMCFLPLDRAASVRTLLRPGDRQRARRWMLWLLRFQVGVVYFYGGIAKLGSDWLLRGEPLAIWLHADAELWLLRPFAGAPWLPFAFGWAGMLFDLSIVPLLLWRRTRAVAYVAVVAFHACTALLFPIGMFPFIMSVGATLFFDADWPRTLLGGRAMEAEATGPRLGRPGAIAIAVYAVVQVALPLRHFLYPGNTLWTEEGFRWSWRVMLIDKVGDLTFTVVGPDGQRSVVRARDWLTPQQQRQVSTQPDMILQLAHVIADDLDARGRGPVRVYADAEVAWNGRRHARLVDPGVDLVREHDSLAPKRWILPAPTSEPRR